MIRKTILYLFLILISSFYYSQHSESIIKMYCNCDPLTTSHILEGNRIAFIQNEAKSFFGVKLTFNLLEKTNGQWIRKYKQNIDLNIPKTENNEQISLENFSFALSDENYKEINIIQLDEQYYFYTIINLGMQGTAYNGLNTYLFYFQNLDLLKKPVKILYERLDGKFSGKYLLEDGTVNENYNFITEINKFITYKFGEVSDNIDDPRNFHLKWIGENINVHERIQNNHQAYVKFVYYIGSDFYNSIELSNEVNEIENDRFKVITGFKTPVIVYDKENDQSIVVYIPQGWPNGGAWGSRSFYPTNIDGKTITIESSEEILIIDIESEISNGYILKIQKE